MEPAGPVGGFWLWGRFVDGLAGFAANEQVGQTLRARQTTDMGGEDTIGAEFHGVLPLIDGRPDLTIASALAG